MERETKVLLQLFEQVSNARMFFLIWFAVVAVCVWALRRYYLHVNRRNFRPRTPSELIGVKAVTKEEQTENRDLLGPPQ